MKSLEALLHEYRQIAEDTHTLERVLLSLHDSLSAKETHGDIFIKEDISILPSYSTCGRGNGICNILGELNFSVIKGKKNSTTEFIESNNKKIMFVLSGEVVVNLVKNEEEKTVVLEETDSTKIDDNYKYSFVFVQDSTVFIFDDLRKHTI